MFIAAAYSSFGQSQNWWRVNGNTPSATDYLGTQNNTPLIIKTNGTEWMRLTPGGRLGIGTTAPARMLDVNGQSRFRLKVECDSLLEASMLKINGLAGGDGILKTDATGNVNKLPYTGSTTDVLTGVGTFTPLGSLLPAPLWQQGTTGIFHNGHVGINKSNPQYALDIAGDVNVSNNVYVGGGIVVAQRVKLDTLKFNSSGGRIAGTGNVVEVIGDLKTQNKLEVQGNALFGGNLKALNGIQLDNLQNGIKFIPDNNGGGTFVYGKTAIPFPLIPACASGPYYSTINHQLQGSLQLYYPTSSGNYFNGSGLLNIQTFTNGGCSIDASVGGSVSPNAGLLINYFCGANTYINTGNNGGEIHLGKTIINGKKSLLHPDAWLSVNGKIVCRELYITKSSDWPDYVFEKDYKLMELKKLKSYYEKHKHLPDIPSADEIHEKGIDASEMIKLLLKKIEELTLYIVELEEKIEKK
jgi:hypothetical protein